MKAFAGEIMEYADNMKRVCSDLKANMDSARPVMKDEASQKAFQKIEAFADNLISSLPEAELAAEKLRESAKYLDQALGIQI
jgi:hypothetical protein